jgi:Fe-S-cluster-containing hydrogenase component 2
MKTLAKVRDSICENGEFCNAVANCTLVCAFGGIMIESIIVLS